MRNGLELTSCVPGFCLLGLVRYLDGVVEMTNTISSIYTTVTTGFTQAVDGYVGIAVLVTVTLAGLALAAKFLPRKKKIA